MNNLKLQQKNKKNFKTLKFTSTFFLIIFIAFSATAQDYFTKTIQKSYPVNTKIKFLVDNKYGKIHIENNTSDNIDIKVTLTAKAGNQKHADDFFNSVKINFSNSDSLIQAVTDIEKEIKVKEFSIDYDIKMPENIKLNLSNKYGDVYIDKLTAVSQISIKYGNFKANTLIFGDIKPRTYINLEYSNALFDECDWLKINSSYSKLQIHNAEGLIIKSKYSQIDIRKATFIAADSKYDQPYKIKEVRNFAITGKYSAPEIEKLGSLLDADLKYSDLSIDQVSADFSKIDLHMSYGNAEIEFSENASYSLTADSEYGSVDIPESDNVNEMSQKNESKTCGFVGKNKKSSSSVTISVRYGNVELK
jgi:hypothetical protein